MGMGLDMVKDMVTVKSMVIPFPACSLVQMNIHAQDQAPAPLDLGTGTGRVVRQDLGTDRVMDRIGSDLNPARIG